MHSNEAIHKMKRKSTEREKRFANHISDKGLVSKVYKELTELNSKTNKHTNKNIPIKKMGRETE